MFDREQLRALAAGPAAWLERCAQHVGNCKGDSSCSCGLAVAQLESRSLLAALEDEEEGNLG